MKINKPALKIAAAGLMAAVIALSSWILIPTPWGIPFTLQTFAIALCAYFLGAKLGTITVAVYVAVGAVGLPVFSGFQSGFGVLLGTAGGYIWGFLPMALLCGTGLKFKNKFAALGFGMIGLVFCHFLGVLQFSAVSGRSLAEAFLLASMPYLIKDVLSVALAYFVSLGAVAGVKKSGLAGGL